MLTAMSIYSLNTSQVIKLDKLTLVTLQSDKAPSKIPTKYFDYTYIFSANLAMELLENTGINEHAIKLIKEKKLLYGPIYALNLVELETLKAYIETYLKTGFI